MVPGAVKKHMHPHPISEENRNRGQGCGHILGCKERRRSRVFRGGRGPAGAGGAGLLRGLRRGTSGREGEAGSGRESAECGGLRPASAFALLRRLGRGDRGPGADPAGSDPAGRAAGGAALRKGGEAVQQAIGEISQKAAFRLKKRRPVGRRSFFSVWSDMGRFCGG